MARGGRKRRERDDSLRFFFFFFFFFFLFYHSFLENGALYGPGSSKKMESAEPKRKLPS